MGRGNVNFINRYLRFVGSLGGKGKKLEELSKGNGAFEVDDICFSEEKFL